MDNLVRIGDRQLLFQSSGDQNVAVQLQALGRVAYHRLSAVKAKDAARFIAVLVQGLNVQTVGVCHVAVVLNDGGDF